MPTPQVDSIQLGELNCWRIRHGQAELVIAQQGAHIISYQIDGDQPLIWSKIRCAESLLMAWPGSLRMIIVIRRPFRSAISVHLLSG